MSYWHFTWLNVWIMTPTTISRTGLTPGPPQRTLHSKCTTTSAFPIYILGICCPFLQNLSLHLAAGKCQRHAGNAERGSRGGWGENQRWRRDAHDSVEQPSAEPEPTAAVCHLHKHTFPPEYCRHRWERLIWSLGLWKKTPKNKTWLC